MGGFTFGELLGARLSLILILFILRFRSSSAVAESRGPLDASPMDIKSVLKVHKKIVRVGWANRALIVSGFVDDRIEVEAHVSTISEEYE